MVSANTLPERLAIDKNAYQPLAIGSAENYLHSLVGVAPCQWPERTEDWLREVRRSQSARLP